MLRLEEVRCDVKRGLRAVTSDSNVSYIYYVSVTKTFPRLSIDRQYAVIRAMQYFNVLVCDLGRGDCGTFGTCMQA